MPLPSKDPTPPPGWPPDVTYITQSRLSPTFNTLHLPLVSSSSQGQKKKLPATHTHPKDLVRIKPITQDGHPAKGQCGLFAVKKLEPGRKVIDYLGVLHTRPHPESDYDLSLLKTMIPSTSSINDSDNEHPLEVLSIALDASTHGNASRFINDYRGIAPKPNCEFREVRDEHGWLGMEVWTLPLGKDKAGKGGGGGVGKGVELCVSYGKGFWRERKEEEA